MTVKLAFTTTVKGSVPIRIHAYALAVAIVTCFEKLAGCGYNTFGFVGPLALSSSSVHVPRAASLRVWQERSIVT